MIALLEDDEALREGLAVFFRSKGFEVCGAATGHELVEQVLSRKPDLVIADLTQGELPAEGGDEIGRLGRVLNRLLRDQRDTVKQVSEASGHLSRAAADLMQISRGSTQNISQLVNSISQISSTPSRR